MPARRSTHASTAALAWLAMFALAIACSSPSQDAGAGGAFGGQTGAAGAGGGLGAGGAAGAGCNGLAEDAPSYDLTWDTGAAPAPRGGTFTDGTYVIVHAKGYGLSLSPDAAFGRDRVAITGTSWQEVEGIPPYDVNPDRHTTRTMSVAPPDSLTLTRLCPAGGGQTTYRFSTSATGFSLFHDEQGVTFELVYARE